MNVAIWLLLAVLALPLAEIAVFVLVGLWAGFTWALLGIVTGSLTGAAMLRSGGGHVSRLRVVLGEQRITALEADSAGTMFLLAGFLLLVPGFITDILALILLVGPLRRGIAQFALRKMKASEKRADGVVDLERDEWRQVPPDRLSDRRDRR